MEPRFKVGDRVTPSHPELHHLVLTVIQVSRSPHGKPWYTLSTPEGGSSSPWNESEIRAHAPASDSIQWLSKIKIIRTQTSRQHTVVEFVNGGRACSCGKMYGRIPYLRPAERLDDNWWEMLD